MCDCTGSLLHITNRSPLATVLRTSQHAADPSSWMVSRIQHFWSLERDASFQSWAVDTTLQIEYYSLSMQITRSCCGGPPWPTQRWLNTPLHHNLCAKYIFLLICLWSLLGVRVRYLSTDKSLYLFSCFNSTCPSGTALLHYFDASQLFLYILH